MPHPVTLSMPGYQPALPKEAAYSQPEPRTRPLRCLMSSSPAHSPLTLDSSVVSRSLMSLSRVQFMHSGREERWGEPSTETLGRGVPVGPGI